MARFVFKYNDKQELFATSLKGEKKTIIKGSNVDFLLEALKDEEIERAILQDNQLTLQYANDQVIFEDFNLFIDDRRFQLIQDSYEAFIRNSVNKKEKPVLNEKPKVNRKKSVSSRGMKAFSATLILIGALAIGYDIAENKSNYPEAYNEYAYDADVEADVQMEDAPALATYAFEAPKSILTKEEFTIILNEYANDNNVDISIIKLLTSNNNDYSSKTLNHYQTIVDYLAFLNNNNYSTEIINNCKVILGTSYTGRFLVIPTNIEKVHSIVQVNPGVGSSALYTYSSYLDAIRNGNTPDYIMIGSANMELDFASASNGNMLETLTTMSLEKGIDINNIGILGFSGSGQTALLNGGNILDHYPEMNVRICNLDAYYIDGFINEVNCLLNGSYCEHESQLRALLKSNAEILSIIPRYSGTGIVGNRPTEALNQSMALADYLSNSNVIVSNCTDHGLYPNEAYRLHLMDYLSGTITKDDLINGEDYLNPDIVFNQDYNTWEYKENTDTINDTIYFG